MNKFEKQIEKFNELKKNGKDAYLKFGVKNIGFNKIDDYEVDWTFEKVIFKKLSVCFIFKMSDVSFDILNEEEYLIEQKKIIENRLKEIEEEKKPKIEVGKTYVIRKKDDHSDICIVFIKELSNNTFIVYTSYGSYSWAFISEYDFQEVDISIKEFFENNPQKYWKNS